MSRRGRRGSGEQLAFVFTRRPVPPSSERMTTTQGTRLAWCDLAGWLSCWEEIQGRRARAPRFAAESAHLAALAARPNLIDRERSPDLVEALVQVATGARPAKGLRADHPTTPILSRAKNRLAQLQARAGRASGRATAG